jgi:membrane protein DedA with SNARE-associated domain
LGFHVYLVAGIMKMPYLKFLVLDIISSILTIIVMVGLGYISGNSFQVIKKRYHKD